MHILHPADSGEPDTLRDLMAPFLNLHSEAEKGLDLLRPGPEIDSDMSQSKL